MRTLATSAPSTPGQGSLGEHKHVTIREAHQDHTGMRIPCFPSLMLALVPYPTQLNIQKEIEDTDALIERYRKKIEGLKSRLADREKEEVGYQGCT